MTNPTLERAAKAVWDAVCTANDEKSGGYAGTMHNSPYYVDGFVDPNAIARAVLMAVREPDGDMVRAGHNADPLGDGVEKAGLIYVPVFAAMIDAILNDGEGE